MMCYHRKHRRGGPELAPEGERFTAKGPDDLVRLADGSTDLGHVPDGLPVPAGPIELPRGGQRADGRTGSGLLHIEARHGAQIRAAGFTDVAHFVADVASHVTEIRQDEIGKLFLVRRATDRTRRGDAHDALIAGLARDASGGWRVETAGPFRARYLEKREVLWQAVHTAAPQPDGMAAPSSSPPTSTSASEGRSSARDQSVSNIGDAGPPDKKPGVGAEARENRRQAGGPRNPGRGGGGVMPEAR